MTSIGEIALNNFFGAMPENIANGPRGGSFIGTECLPTKMERLLLQRSPRKSLYEKIESACRERQQKACRHLPREGRCIYCGSEMS